MNVPAIAESCVGRASLKRCSSINLKIRPMSRLIVPRLIKDRVDSISPGFSVSLGGLRYIRGKCIVSVASMYPNEKGNGES